MDVLSRIFKGRVEVSGVIDHIPVRASSQDWREERLRQAQERYGRPFKCAGSQLEHEVLVKTRPASAAIAQAAADGLDDEPRGRSRTPRRSPAFQFGRR
jgi:hypothetical protein